MRNARSRPWVYVAALGALVLAGCGEALPIDTLQTGADSSAVDLPSPDERLRRFRKPRFELSRGVRRAHLPAELPGGQRDPFEAARRDGADAAGHRRLPEGDCAEHCGDDATCRLTCLDGLVAERSGDDGCRECGRETGFLPRPELWVESVVGGQEVVLRWTRIKQADHFVVYGLQWPYGYESAPVSLSWRAPTDTLRAALTPGYFYVFYVVAIGADGARSKPSLPVTVHL